MRSGNLKGAAKTDLVGSSFRMGHTTPYQGKALEKVIPFVCFGGGDQGLGGGRDEKDEG